MSRVPPQHARIVLALAAIFAAPGCAAQPRVPVARTSPEAGAIARTTPPIAPARRARVPAPASPAPALQRQETAEPGLGVRRPLTENEKEEARNGSRFEMEEAWEQAREQRLSEERLAGGIYRGELRGVDARLKSSQAAIRAAYSGRLHDVREQVHAALAAEARAREIAREERAAALEQERRAGEGLKGKALAEARKEARRIREETIARIDARMARAIEEALRHKQQATEAQLAIELEMQPKLDAAEAEADKARARSAELFQTALDDAARREEEARMAAAEVHEQNCSRLETATIADYVASQEHRN